MIHSIFIINQSGDVVLEKHWKSIIQKAVCDYFFEAQTRAGSNPGDIPPVIAAPHHFLINITRNKLHYVAIVTEDVPPLFVIEFLHRMADIIVDYFGTHTETVIKDNYVMVYEIFDEMLDNGFPLATESNILKELIRPPDMLRNIKDRVTGDHSKVSDILPSGQMSNIPWRRAGVKYNHNEAYFDFIEELDCIIDKSGSVVFSEIQGYADCLMKLSGMPDLNLTFINPRILDDVSFHPCVRFKRWETEKLLSFVPPDGKFRLISYHISGQNFAIPIGIKHSVVFRDGGLSRLELTVSPKQTMGKVLENVSVEIPLPKNVSSAALSSSEGKWNFDSSTKTVRWEIGKLESGKNPSLKGGLMLLAGSPVPDSNPTIQVKFVLPQIAVSGLRVNRLDMYKEKYKPFKGVKYLTKAGKFQIRT